MKNYAYFTLLTDDSYVKGVLLLKEGLRRVNSKYPLICMITKSVSPYTQVILDKAHVKTIQLEEIPTPKNIMEHNLKIDQKQANVWKSVLTKFQVFTFDQYEKIIFLDADLLILKNVDHCFELPHMTAALDGEYDNLWPIWPHFNTGFFVIKPDKNLLQKLTNFVENLDLENVKDYRGKPYIIADQEILNLYYSDWVDKPELHLNKYYNIFPVHTPDCHVQDILENAYFVHFVGTKPWVTTTGLMGEKIHPCTPLLKMKVGCTELYIIALAIIALVYDNDFNDLEWDALENFGVFYHYIAHLARDLFRDFKTAEKYIQAAITQNPNDPIFQIEKEEIDKCLLAEKVRPTIREVVLNVFENAANINLPAYELLTMSRLTENLYSDNAVNVTLYLWSEIEKAMGTLLTNRAFMVGQKAEKNG